MRRLSQRLAVAVALIAALRLCDYLMGWNLGIDRLGFRESSATVGMTAMTRTAPATALGLLLVGCALLLPTRPPFSIAFQSLTWLAGLLGWLGLSFYLYRGEPLPPFAQMAVHTAIAFLVLSAGILCTRPNEGVMALLTSDGPAGSVTRRLMPAVLVVPTLLGWLYLTGQTAGWFGVAAGTALLALATVVFLGPLVWVTARLLHTADIERNTARVALGESEARFQATADAAPVMLWMAGTDGGCTFFNRAWLDFTGRAMEQELGNGWTEGVHPADLEHCVRTYLDAFDGRREFTMEYRLRRHDGEYRWVLDSGTPRFEAGGRFVGYIGSAVDVTAVKHADERVQLAVEAAPNAMVMANDQGQITLLNAQAERVFGYDRDELLGRSIDVLVPDSLRSAHAGYRNGYIHEPSARVMGAGRDLYGRRKNGSEFPVEVGLNPILSSEGKAILASIIDITARRQLEEETAQQRGQLAHLSRVTMLGELSGALAHELHQPLTAILANAQTALRVLAQNPPDVNEVRNILTDIAEDDKRASEVIRGLRALLRKGEVQYLPLDLNEVALTVLRLIRSDLSSRGVAVTTDLAAGLPLVEGDRVQLQQVLLNLVMNGCEAMDGIPTDRRLTVQTREALEDGVEVSVVDCGSGIPQENLEGIFEPFVSTKAEGMGLGLAVCRTIVAAHNGRLWAINNAHRGATVRFTLPAKHPLPPLEGAS
jgi:PAS domain S-box-containing protein